MSMHHCTAALPQLPSSNAVVWQPFPLGHSPSSRCGLLPSQCSLSTRPDPVCSSSCPSGPVKPIPRCQQQRASTRHPSTTRLAAHASLDHMRHDSTKYMLQPQETTGPSLACHQPCEQSTPFCPLLIPWQAGSASIIITHYYVIIATCYLRSPSIPLHEAPSGGLVPFWP